MHGAAGDGDGRDAIDKAALAALYALYCVFKYPGVKGQSPF